MTGVAPYVSLRSIARHLLFVTGIVSMCGFAGPSRSQGWQPQRHVEIIVPGGAGGSLDITARSVHKALEDLRLLPVSSSVVNRPGGAHLPAYNTVRQKSGDPHVLAVATSMLLTGHIIGRLPFTYSDITPVSFLVTEYVAFAVRADSPIKNGREMIERLKKDATSLAFGMGSSRGGTYHIALGLPLQSAAIDSRRLRTAFFAGAGGGVTQVLGGHVDVSVSGLSAILPHVENGKLRVLAVSSPKRISGVLANVPTWHEQGYKGTFGSTRSIIAPRDIGAEQLAYWEAVMRKVVESPEFRKAAEVNQWDATFRGASETRAYMELEYAKFKSVMSYLGLLEKSNTSENQ